MRHVELLEQLGIRIEEAQRLARTAGRTDRAGAQRLVDRGVNERQPVAVAADRERTGRPAVDELTNLARWKVDFPDRCTRRLLRVEENRGIVRGPDDIVDGA